VVYDIATTDGAVFDHRTNADNTWGGDSTASLYFQRRGDDLTGSKQFWRWWSAGFKLEQTNGNRLFEATGIETCRRL
jgi:hypothetical protein